ncbi:MAG: hypothetical protein JSU92_10020, partial [Deltaproteobacteria bacterium]
WQACGLGFVVGGSGSYTVDGQCTDTCGNISPLASSTFPVDVDPPTVDVAPITCDTDGDVTVSATCVEVGSSGLASCEVSIDGGANWYDSPHVYVGLGDGNYTADGQAADNCGNTASDLTPETFDVDTIDPTVAIIQPTTGEVVGTDTVVVRFTADDLGSGPDTASGVVTLAPYGSQAATYSAPTFTAVFTGVAIGGYTATACVDDLCGNTGCASVDFSVGFAMSIMAPTNGAVVVTVNGITYGSVIASIPFDLTWVNGISPYDTSGLTVMADGLTTTPDGPITDMLSVTSATTASGRILVACNGLSGSFGTLTNVTITAYGVSDAVGPAAPDSVTVTVQLGEVGLESVVIADSVTSFTVAVNAYYDSSLGDAPKTIVLSVAFTPTVVKVGDGVLNNCIADNPVSGSSGVFTSTEFSAAPTVSLCSNTLGEIELSSVQTASTTSPVGFFNVGSINFVRVGAVGSSTELTITLIDFCNTSDGCYATFEVPLGYPWTVWPAYIKDGRVDIISP